MSSKPEPKKTTKGMCIATRCTSVEQFIQMFHRFVDEESFFVSTLNTRAPGLETSFSVQLQDGTPVLRGLCVVMQAWTDGNNPFKTPGVRLGIKRLTANSMVVFEQLLITRSAAKPPPVPAAVVTPVKPVVTKPLAGTVPKATATPPKGTPLKPVSIAIGVPKAIPKTPFTETAPAKSAPSRVEVSTPARAASEPARAASEPIPEPINPEPTDVIEEKTDVREPKKPVAELEPVDIKPIAAKPSEIAFKPIVDKSTDPKPAASKPAEPVDPHVQETKVDPHVQETKVDPFAGERAPGSDLVLPANPLMNLSDESLEGYVDCTLYEETGNFFPVDGSDEAGFVDEVVPPPVLAPKPAISRTLTPIPYAMHEPRLPTVTPLPPTPTVATALDAVDAERVADAAPSGPGSQSLIVPPPTPSPPMPRESVMVDPELIARGSTPAVDHSSFDSPTLTREPTGRSNFDASDLPLPATPPRAKSKRGSWWLLGGALGVLAGAAALVIVTMSSSNGGAAPKTPPKPAAKEVAQVTPPVDPKQETGDTADTDDGPPPDEPPPGSGPPMVGSGPCKVVVASTPAGSMVALDDKTVGPSPLTVGTTCEKHKLDISHARYQSTTKFVTLAEGKDQEVEVTLSRPTHVVTVSSNPSGAQIFIDGRSAGTTPSKLSVLGFTTLKLEFKKTGYQPASAKLYSKVSQDKVAVKLNKW